VLTGLRQAQQQKGDQGNGDLSRRTTRKPVWSCRSATRLRRLCRGAACRRS
jgi:hypothetical protein